MPVIHNARDVRADYFDASDRSRLPVVAVLVQRDDHQLAVHFRHRQSPWHCLAFIVLEIWRLVDGTDKAIYDAQLSVRANEFAESLPITLIESVDVEV